MMFRCPGLILELRKPEIADLDVLAGWIASQQFIDLVGGQRLPTPAAYRARAEEMLQENADDACPNKYLMSVDKRHGTPIGLAMICKIDWKNRHAECAYIIGNLDYRGTLASGDFNVTIYNYLFNHLHLNKVYGFVYAANEASLRINSFGGRMDGTLRQHRRADGGRQDMHVFSITRSEFAGFVERNARSVLRKHLAQGLIACP